MSDNIILIGFMGCGKTSVGMKLAHALEYDFIDTDLYIEEQQQMKISEIFETRGEQAFRDMETECLKQLSETLHHTIVSTGGGMPLREENAALLNQMGTVFFLKASADVTYERLKEDTMRPLLQTKDPKSAIETMLEKRIPIYDKVCNHIISTDQCSFYAIIHEIMLRV